MAGDEDNVSAKKKVHRERQAGRKAEKKKAKKVHVQDLSDKQKNPKAFTFNSAVRAERKFRRGQDIQSKKHHIPEVDRTPLEPPPVLVAIVGPPKVGKTTLINCLIKSFTRQPLSNIKGPVTIVTGKKQRITLMECNNDINSMIDIAKVADLVLLLVDASFGFEMEIFEFLNICQVHGMPKIMGVLTHLDMIKKAPQLKRTKKTLKHRFWTEVYQGAKLFYLSGMLHGEYLRNEVKNLGRFISVMKFRPLVWRSTHPYMLADRVEDVTPPEDIRVNPKTDRTVCLYGYMRGVPLNKSSTVHIPGCGDLRIKDVSFLPDPCPLPDKTKKRSLVEKEKTIYAPFSGVGGIVYDKDAVYVDLGGSHSYGANLKNDDDSRHTQREIVSSILQTQETLDEKMRHSELRLFSNAVPITGDEILDGKENTENCIPMSDDESSDGSGDENDEVEGDEPPIGKRFTSFDNDDESDDDDDNDDEEEEEESDDDGDEDDSENEERNNHKLSRKKSDKHDGVMSDIAEEDDSGDDESLAIKDSVRWKSNLAQKAADAFLERQSSAQSLWKLVYGKGRMFGVSNEESDNDDDENDMKGGLFRVVTQKQREKQAQKDIMNQEESSLYRTEGVRSVEEMKVLIKDCFVTGKWKKSEDAEELLRLDDASDDDVYGDFEDLETGEKFSAEKQNKAAKSSTGDDEGGKGSGNDEEEKPSKPLSKKEIMERKKKLKEKFDAEYDDKDDEKNFYEDLKQEVTQQAQINKSEFEGLEDDVRVVLEGFRPGMYVRVELSQVPCELLDHFDPTYPLIIGGLQKGEENIGFVQVRLKKHRWYKRILKTKNPLIMSVGWRRFQSLPIYSKLEDDMKNRMLKYTPEHVTCMAHFWGPSTPQGTGFLAVQDVAVKVPGFRIAATGAVVELDQSTQIMKKLKLTGVPLKVHKKTAFIKDMFTSAIEVARFEGAKIRTVSGIRGQIKKACIRPPGAFRATFEDRILMSDIVFCRTWYKVDVPQLYNPVTSLLLPPELKNAWQGMKTTGQLKRERGLRSEAQQDSMYTPIERQPKVFKPLVIPRTLQKNLPYRDKPKSRRGGGNNLENKRVAIIREPHERRVDKLMTMIRTNFAHKQRKLHLASKERHAERQKEVDADNVRRQRRQKEMRREVFRTLDKLKRKEEQAAEKGAKRRKR